MVGDLAHAVLLRAGWVWDGDKYQRWLMDLGPMSLVLAPQVPLPAAPALRDREEQRRGQWSLTLVTGHEARVKRHLVAQLPNLRAAAGALCHRAATAAPPPVTLRNATPAEALTLLLVPRTAAEARAFILACVSALGPLSGSFHPATPGKRYVTADGARVFDARGAALFDERLAAAANLCDALYVLELETALRADPVPVEGCVKCVNEGAGHEGPHVLAGQE